MALLLPLPFAWVWRYGRPGKPSMSLKTLRQLLNCIQQKEDILEPEKEDRFTERFHFTAYSWRNHVAHRHD